MKNWKKFEYRAASIINGKRHRGSGSFEGNSDVSNAAIGMECKAPESDPTRFRFLLEDWLKVKKESKIRALMPTFAIQLSCGDIFGIDGVDIDWSSEEWLNAYIFKARAKKSFQFTSEKLKLCKELAECDGRFFALQITFEDDSCVVFVGQDQFEVHNKISVESERE